MLVFPDGSLFSHSAEYSAMSNVVLSEPSPLLFFFLLMVYMCLPDNFIILCGLLSVPDCVL